MPWQNSFFLIGQGLVAWDPGGRSTDFSMDAREGRPLTLGIVPSIKFASGSQASRA